MQEPRSEVTERTERWPVELPRTDGDSPVLAWLAVDSPEQSFLLEEDDHVLDSHYNPQFDNWEVLLKLVPHEEDAE